MYSKSLQLGGNLIYIVRGAYERRILERVGDEDDVYAYIDSRSGEYDEREKLIMDDPYVDGWEWFTEGKQLEDWKPSRWLSRQSKEERRRLFELGFNASCDFCKEEDCE